MTFAGSEWHFRVGRLLPNLWYGAGFPKVHSKQR